MHMSLAALFVVNSRGEMDWISHDRTTRYFKDAIMLEDHADTALFGRVTYQMMESYWPTRSF
jgi:dihydrofolate reductase